MSPWVPTHLLHAFGSASWALTACILLLPTTATRTRADALMGIGLLVGAVLQALDTITVRGGGAMPLLPWALLAAAAWWLLPRPQSVLHRASEVPWRQTVFAIGIAVALHAVHGIAPLQPTWQ